MPLRPRGVGELLDAAAELLRGRFLVYLGLAALILAPVRVGSYYAQSALHAAREVEWLGGALYGFFVIVLPPLVQAAVSAVVIVLVYGQLVGRDVPTRRALALLLRRLPALVGLLALLVVVVGGALLVVVVASAVGLALLPAFLWPPLLPAVLFLALYLSFRIYLATPSLMLERLGVIDAVRRSFELTRSGFLRWLGVWALSLTLASFFTGLGQLGDDLTVRRGILSLLGISRGTFDAFYLPLSIVLTAIGLAFAAVVITAFYLDARMRLEAFDLHMRRERMRAGAPGARHGGA